MGPLRRGIPTHRNEGRRRTSHRRGRALRKGTARFRSRMALRAGGRAVPKISGAKRRFPSPWEHPASSPVECFYSSWLGRSTTRLEGRLGNKRGQRPAGAFPGTKKGLLRRNETVHLQRVFHANSMLTAHFALHISNENLKNQAQAIQSTSNQLKK